MVGTHQFADATVRHGTSGYSLRFDSVATAPDNQIRVHQIFQVAPFRQYHFSVWIKTQSGTKPTVGVLGYPGARHLAFPKWDYSNSDWTQYHYVFNSLNSTTIDLVIGVWGNSYDVGSRCWIDDFNLEEVGLVNVLRRPGCPLTITSTDDPPVVYEEGVDFETVADPLLGHDPWWGKYSSWHTPPKITLTANSRIPLGSQLKVSFYAPILIHSHQVACCPIAARALKNAEFDRTNAAFNNPKAFFLGDMSEIRTANWCQDCVNQALGSGDLLGANVYDDELYIQYWRPDAKVFLFADMATPCMNAVAHRTTWLRMI